jgi:putative acetyltransferase
LPLDALADSADRCEVLVHIEVDNLTHPDVLALLREHLANMHEITPPEYVFALDAAKLRQPGVTFWTAWDGEVLLGCGALKQLSPTEGEVKSMRTPQALRRRGAGRAILQTIVEAARERGYTALFLETGSHPDFSPAQRLYESFGFTRCGPFSDYVENGNSVFMHLPLGKDTH